MAPQTLTLILLLLHSSLSLPLPSPSPSLSPTPNTHHLTPHHRRDHPERRTEEGRRWLNVGEVVGLAFLSAAIVVQVALAGFLVYKKRKLGKIAERESRASASPLRRTV